MKLGGCACAYVYKEDQVRMREAALKESMSVYSSTIPDALMAAFAFTSISSTFYRFMRNLELHVHVFAVLQVVCCGILPTVLYSTVTHAFRSFMLCDVRFVEGHI